MNSPTLKIVLTSGCFDVFHYGHLKLLEFARAQGNYLIVAINSDNSVKQLKGQNRPIHNQNQRKEILESLKMVNEVVIFDDLTVTNTITQVNPRIWVKGSEYTLETLNQNERIAAQNLGVEIKFFPYIKGLSSSKLIEEYQLQK